MYGEGDGIVAGHDVFPAVYGYAASETAYPTSFRRYTSVQYGSPPSHPANPYERGTQSIGNSALIFRGVTLKYEDTLDSADASAAKR
jgi:hypothetical protein